LEGITYATTVKVNGKKYYINDVVYNTPYGKVSINTEAVNVGIFLSGGMDSAVLLYLVAKTFSERNITTSIQPVTVRRGNPTGFKYYDRVDIYPYANRIIKYVRDAFPNVTIYDTIKEDANYWWITTVDPEGGHKGSYTTTQTNLSNFLTWKYADDHLIEKLAEQNMEPQQGIDTLYCEYNGVTKNPPEDADVPLSEESHRDHVRNYVDGFATVVDYGKFHRYYEPIRNADKRITMWLAHELNILEDFLDITRSCEGGPVETENFTTECMKCWWCLERHWALENYNK
jgi:cobalamin-dependent methionine synthase I